MGYLTLLSATLVAIVFAVSGFSKLRDLPGFAQAVGALGHGLVPRGGVRTVARVVVGLELATPLLVLVPLTRSVGLAVAAALLTGFALLAFRAAGGPQSVPCRCFGTGTRPLGVSHGVRNSMLAGLAVAGVFGSMLDGLRGLHVAGAAITLVAAATGAALTVFFDDVVALFRAPQI